MKDMLDDIPDDNLKKKLQNYQEDPGEEVWSRIHQNLPDTKISDRLREYYESPDDDVWTSIQDSLRFHYIINRINFAGYIIAGIAFLSVLLPWVIGKNNEGAPGNIVSTGSVVAPQEKSADSVVTETASPSNDAMKNNLQAEQSAHLRKSTPPEPAHKKEQSKALESTSGKEQLSKEKRSARVGIPDRSTTTFNSLISNEADKKQDEIAVTAEEVTTEKRLTPPQTDVPASEIASVDKPVEVTKTESAGTPVTLGRRLLPTQDAVGTGTDSISGTTSGEFVASAVNGDSSVTASPDNNVTVIQSENVQKDSLADEPVSEKDVIRNVVVPPEEKKKRKNPSSLYALAMPTFGYQQIKPLTDDDIFIQSIRKVSAFSPKRLGVRAEAGFSKQFRKIAWNVGLLYYQRKQTIEYNYLDGENFNVVQEGKDSMAYSIQPIPITASFEYELRNVGVVSGFAFTLRSSDMLLHQVGLGAEIHKSLARTNVERSSDASLFLFGNVYYKISYKLGKNFSAVFQPTINYSLQVDERLNAPFYVKPYGLGLNFGLAWQFK